MLAMSVTAATNTAIPYVPTRHDTVKDLLWLAEVGTNDVVYDLGSGDGRIVIAAVRDFRARKAVGIELNRQLVQESREKANAAGVADRVTFIEGDLFTTDFSDASVVVLYLGHDPNRELRAKIFGKLKPGTRVLSHQFGMGEWIADKTLDVRAVMFGMYGEIQNPFANNSEVPDFKSIPSRRDHDTCSMWIVPAPVAGVWRGTLHLETGESDVKLTLYQRLSGAFGSVEITGSTNMGGGAQADLWGTHLRVSFWSTNRPLSFSLFDGHVDGDQVKGTFWIGQKEIEWAGKREKGNLAGTWKFATPTNSALVLKIEGNGQLSATYFDRNRTPTYIGTRNLPIPITDIYDFGGGFYFTLLLGREEASRRTGPENGWVIGDAIETDRNLQGRIAFYPYPDSYSFPTERRKPQPKPNKDVKQPLEPDRWHQWSAKRIDD